MSMIARMLVVSAALVSLARADVTVDTTGDVPADDGACTLREAIVAANTDASVGGCVRTPATVDTIDFSLGAGIPSIVVTDSDLPAITAPVIIDGATGGATRIEISGGGTRARGVSFLGAPDASGSEIRNLVVNGFTASQLLLSNGTGIVVEGNLIGLDPTGTFVKDAGATGIEICNGFSCGTSQGHRIGGPDAAQRNVIATSSTMIVVGGSNVTIQGNFIGTNATGTAAVTAGFTTGISLNNVGGTVIEGNVIAGSQGVFVGGNPALARTSGTLIQGNLIGTDLTGTVDLGGGGDGVVVAHAIDTLVGGATPGAGNLISGHQQGVSAGSSGVNGTSVGGTTIQGNRIGTDATGTAGLGNAGAGIALGGGGPALDDAVVEGNRIAFNGQDGIEVNCGACVVRMSENAIGPNGELGIDLNGGSQGVTPNDPGDGDSGPNGRQNFPELDDTLFPGGTTIEGTLASTADTTFRVEVFASDGCDPSGNGEGQEFVGAHDAVTTDGNGDAAFTVTLDQSVPAGKIMTATAIAPDGSTSELSPCTQSPPSTTSTTTTTSSSTSTLVGATTTTSTTTPTSVSTTATSLVTTSTTFSTTTTTAQPATCELLDGKKLLLKTRGIGLLSDDADLSLGGGNGSADDPVLHGGSLRIVSVAGDGFDDTYALPAARWRYKKKEGQNRGYQLRRTKPFKGVTIQPGRRLKVVANGSGFGHTLGADPDPVDVVLTIGGHCYCLRFGGDVTFKPGKKWLAKEAPSPTGCPAPD
jgi:CSLREA domain-containing protein